MHKWLEILTVAMDVQPLAPEISAIELWPHNANMAEKNPSYNYGFKAPGANNITEYCGPRMHKWFEILTVAMDVQPLAPEISAIELWPDNANEKILATIMGLRPLAPTILLNIMAPECTNGLKS